ncbi:MAG: carboxylating nicotinate-nucleotide diphosphorylase [Bacteroidota bacterium]|nr:carboxylating nicotinate-nucleotide diphosphorylase [Bacteroidota bacterium]
MNLEDFIRYSLQEDIGSGDHTSLACIPAGSMGKAHLLVKDSGILAGMEVARQVFLMVDASLQFKPLLQDGKPVEYGMIAFEVEGAEQAIVTAERLVLNCMQRMSGIATTTRKYVDLLDGLHTRVLDTRKTTPLMRELEKWAVRIGGGTNHRMGLYDMILIKDNHVDYAGGISNAIQNVQHYLENTGLKVPVEIETRTIKEVEQVLEAGNVQRIMLDNFSPELLKQAVTLIGNRYETEASGGINLNTVRSYAETGVDFVSVGALTHSVKSLDLSLKAIK